MLAGNHARRLCMGIAVNWPQRVCISAAQLVFCHISGRSYSSLAHQSAGRHTSVHFHQTRPARRPLIRLIFISACVHFFGLLAFYLAQFFNLGVLLGTTSNRPMIKIPGHFKRDDLCQLGAMLFWSISRRAKRFV